MRSAKERLQRRVEELERRMPELLRALEESQGAGKRQAAPFSRRSPNAHPDKPGRKAGALRTERNATFTFLYCPGLEATNYRAEQAIRPMVVTRRGLGRQSHRAGRTHAERIGQHFANLPSATPASHRFSGATPPHAQSTALSVDPTPHTLNRYMRATLVLRKDIN